MKLLPLVMQLGEYLKMGLDHYATLSTVPKESRVELMTVYLKLKLDSWHPVINGKKLLDEETRTAAARFLAGLTLNLSS